ncbi:hypothetical protein [Cognatishimia sp.]|uniref:hypothetical protein n=1 Tax=Cognatishimia sp. TaxID=2211648 RepID=UPI003518AAF5
MVTNNKVLTVSYGTFSCTLEGFEDNFDTMKAIAEYFRDLAADDRYFGAEPPTPDAEMLARIAEREIERRVQARTDQGTLVLTASDAIAEPAPVAASEPVLQDDNELDDDAQDNVFTEAPEDVASDELDDQITEGEETVAIDEDQLAQEREAFFAEVDSVANDHAADVADDVATHEAAEEIQAPASVETAEADEDDLEADEYVAEAPAVADREVETEIDDEPAFEDTEVAHSVSEDVEDVAEIEEPADAEDTAEQEADDDDADDFFAGTKTQSDDGVSSIAAKLSRIRAVVSKAEQNDDSSPYSEDEHAENPAADFLRKSASDIEGSLEDEDDIEAAVNPVKGRVIRMRRSDKTVEDDAAPVAAAPVQEPVAEPTPEPAPAPAEIEEAIGEDTVAEFENGYAHTELDEEEYDEEILENTPPTPRPRANLAEDAPKQESVDRLLDEANTKLEDPDTSRRRTTLAHLRAAVAATRAEKSAGTYEGDKDQSGASREDLADVMRPRRGSATSALATEAPADDGAAPLRLVASQRVDAAPQQQEEVVRPRRVSPADIQSFEPKETSDFAAYAEEVGATELPDILEAAASYLTYVEGRRRFSRPMLMRLAYQLGPDRFQREAGLRSFGQLLRDKKIEKIAGGRFTAAETIRFKPESAMG